MAQIGVLALQGGFAAHADALSALGHEPVLVRTVGDLDGLAGLVLPGGESTTQLKLINDEGLGEPLDRFVRSGRPTMCTCAGIILAAAKVTEPRQPSFGWLDVHVARNAWGRQVDSFEATSDDGHLCLVFIRAPRIVATGAGVEILATLDSEPVMVRQNNVTGATFHPELAGDAAVHRDVFGAASERSAPESSWKGSPNPGGSTINRTP